MNVADAMAQILHQEGAEFLFGYPANPLIDATAAIGIRPIIVRQERVGVHMADGLARVSSGQRLAVFAMQHGPGAENSFGAVAQAYSESVPVLVIPGGYGPHEMNRGPNFSALLNYGRITKSAEQVTRPEHVPDIMRRAISSLRNGRLRPALVEVPWDVFYEEVPGPLAYHSPAVARPSGDPEAISRVAELLVQAKRPVIYAGQGIHYARAWDALRELVELLEAPITTSLEGKSSFPETHRLSLGSGGRAVPGPVTSFLRDADLVVGIGCSFARTNYGIQFPRGPAYVQITLDAGDLDQDVPLSDAIVGDAKLVCEALVAELKERLPVGGRGRADGIAAEIAKQRNAWLAKWRPKLESDQSPITPYRVVGDLAKTVDVAKTVITHDAGSPRDQLSPFWPATTPLSYLGWGKTTQLGYGLGLAMGAKLADPTRLCINIMGDAAIGFTGTDLETAARERIPTLTIVLNNQCMAMELGLMALSTELFRTTDITGDYTAFAKSLGCYAERVTEPRDLVSAIQRAVRATEDGQPALLEVMTSQEVSASVPE